MKKRAKLKIFSFFFSFISYVGYYFAKKFILLQEEEILWWLSICAYLL